MSSRDIYEILKEIQELRNKLNNLAVVKNFTDEEVLALSKMLDVVLNEYEQAIRKKFTDE